MLLRAILEVARAHENDTGERVNTCECLPRTFDALYPYFRDHFVDSAGKSELPRVHTPGEFEFNGIRFVRSEEHGFGPWNAFAGFALYRSR
jgi:hypothetical protein